MSVRKTPGTALANDQTGEVVYTPPEGEQLLTLPILYLSRYIIQNKSNYYRFRLFEAAGGDWRFDRGHVLKREAFPAPEVHEVTDD